MVAWTHVQFVSNHSLECLLVFCFQSGVLFGLGVNMDILISGLPKVNESSQGQLHN